MSSALKFLAKGVERVVTKHPGGQTRKSTSGGYKKRINKNQKNKNQKNKKR